MQKEKSIAEPPAQKEAKAGDIVTCKIDHLSFMTCFLLWEDNDTAAFRRVV